MKNLFIGALTLGILALAGLALAAKPASDTPRYDRNAEYTIRGTVLEIRTHTSTQGYEDMHLMLDTGHGTFEVHLAPVAFLSQRGLTLAKGDEVVVTGSKTPWDAKDVVLAREIQKGDHKVVVRSTGGAPLWPRKLHT
jgi:hypothetical protein